jgi:hypothetical protein
VNDVGNVSYIKVGASLDDGVTVTCKLVAYP